MKKNKRTTDDVKTSGKGLDGSRTRFLPSVNNRGYSIR